MRGSFVFKLLAMSLTKELEGIQRQAPTFISSVHSELNLVGSILNCLNSIEAAIRDYHEFFLLMPFTPGIRPQNITRPIIRRNLNGQAERRTLSRDRMDTLIKNLRAVRTVMLDPSIKEVTGDYRTNETHLIFFALGFISDVKKYDSQPKSPL